MNYYLNSFTPLCFENEESPAIEHFNQPRFVDSSSRREPELESEYPSISSICRADKLVSRLEEGDIVVYYSKKGSFGGLKEKHRRLVAILRIIKKCLSHQEAAEWYKDSGLKVPSNCIVEGSEPYPRQFIGEDCYDENKYRQRVEECPLYFICEPIYKDLGGSINLFDKDMINIFGEVNPSTQNPKARDIGELHNLVNFINRYLSISSKISLL